MLETMFRLTSKLNAAAAAIAVIVTAAAFPAAAAASTGSTLSLLPLLLPSLLLLLLPLAVHCQFLYRMTLFAPHDSGTASPHAATRLIEHHSVLTSSLAACDVVYNGVTRTMTPGRFQLPVSAEALTVTQLLSQQQLVTPAGRLRTWLGKFGAAQFSAATCCLEGSCSTHFGKRPSTCTAQ
jgi:hypothetical protein